MMRTIRVALAVALLGVGAVACAGDPQEEIDVAFKGYYAALLARDFPTACGYNAPEANDLLISTLATQGVLATSCEQAFTAIFDQPGAADIFDAIGRSAAIDDVEVDGNDATVTFTSTVDGEQKTGSIGMRRIDGGWKRVAPG